MAPSLNVVALISGGKDSFFSILHCIKNGHNVVALANLHPPLDDGKQQEDIDSFMYQTIGHTVIPLYSEALGLPLYRQAINGTAVNNQKAYSHQQGPPGNCDETESLIPLLRRVMHAHPNVDAVCSGAILSDYQRTRVESVALRLGLTPLSYLWQYPRLPPHTQTSLLDDMRMVNLKSRIIKVASGGLSSDHLWLDLTDPAAIKMLAKSLGRFGGLEVGSIIGEGGEFESLALSGPKPVWKHQLHVRDLDRIIAESEDGGGSFTVKITNATLSPLDENEASEVTLESLRVPPVFDGKFASILQELRSSMHDSVNSSSQCSPNTVDAWVTDPAPHVRVTDTEILISNVVSGKLDADVATQTREIMTTIQAELHAHRLQLAHITLSTILLVSMSDFATVNAVYQPFFSEPGPPSRVTIACGSGLPSGATLMVSVVANRGPSNMREHLHVQARSYWAPANIGPYSQAVSVPRADNAELSSRFVYVAGQIPLLPASMDIQDQEFAYQAVLALQHLWRVGQALRVHWWTAGAIAFIPRTDTIAAQDRARVIGQAWKLAHRCEKSKEETEEEDIAERSLYRHWGPVPKATLDTPHQYLPDWENVAGCSSSDDANECTPCCYTVVVSELPRDAPVEWWSVGLSVHEGRTHDLVQDWEYKATNEIADALDILKSANNHAEVFCATARAGDVELAKIAAEATVIPCYHVFSETGEPYRVLIRLRT